MAVPYGSNAATTNWWTSWGHSNGWRLSALVAVTPFMEQQALWEQISNPSSFDASNPGTPLTAPVLWPAMGPAPNRIEYGPWATEIPTLRCPSDPGVGLPALGRTNYAVSLGDSIDWSVRGPVHFANNPNWKMKKNNGYAQRSRAADRGAFVPHNESKFRDILDGLSNTVAMAEIATDLGDRDNRTIQTNNASQNPPNNVRDNPKWCEDQGQIDPERPRFWLPGVPTEGVNNGRGFLWADFRPNYSGVHTILPPNSEICGGNNAGQTGLFPPSSRHQGGAHILMADGAVIFVSDSIEAGNSRAGNVWQNGTNVVAPANVPGSISPYGLWGALGTRAARESVEEELNQ